MKDRYFIALLIINSLIALFRVGYVIYYPTDLAPDEALYWDYSRHPQLSYYAKPPLIAYIINLSTSLFGNTEIGVRFPAIIMSALTSLLIYRLTLYLFNDRKLAFLSGIILSLSVGFQLMGILMTIDTPLSFFWVASLYFLAKAFKENKTTQWILAGFMGMLAFLSKYTGILLPFLALLFAFIKDREKLKEKGIYLFTTITLVGLIPVILWNYTNDWVGFKHVFTLAGITDKEIPERGNFNPFRILEYLGGQILITGPSLFPYIILSFYKFTRSIDYKHIFLIIFSLPIFISFMLLSLYTKVEANWPSFGYFAVLPLISALILSTYNTLKYVHLFSLTIALLFTLLIHFTPLLDKIGMSSLLPPEKDPHARLAGWKGLGDFVSKLKGKNTFVFSDKYQITAELAFYVRGNPEVFCVNRGRRMNQYDMWKHKMLNYKGKNAIFVSYSPIDESIKQGFKKVTKEEIYTVIWRNKKVRELYVYLLEGYNGKIKEKITGTY